MAPAPIEPLPNSRMPSQNGLAMSLSVPSSCGAEVLVGISIVETVLVLALVEDTAAASGLSVSRHHYLLLKV